MPFRLPPAPSPPTAQEAPVAPVDEDVAMAEPEAPASKADGKTSATSVTAGAHESESTPAVSAAGKEDAGAREGGAEKEVRAEERAA